MFKLFTICIDTASQSPDHIVNHMLASCSHSIPPQYVDAVHQHPWSSCKLAPA